MAKRKARPKAKKPSSMTLLAFLFIAAAALTLYLSTKTSFAGRVEVSADDDPYMGNTNAPVTMVMFTNYACSFSRGFWANTFPQIKEQYIDTGKVKFVYRDFPLGDGAADSSLAAECADEQGKFWEYNQILFTNIYLDKDSLKQYAADLGLNAEQFNACLDTKKYRDEIISDKADGISYGVKGTPTFYVNGAYVEGDEGFEFFAKLIEKELQK